MKLYREDLRSNCQPAIGAQKRFLHHFLSVLGVSCHAMSQAEESATVALHEFSKGLAVAAADLSHNGGIALFHPDH